MKILIFILFPILCFGQTKKTHPENSQVESLENSVNEKKDGIAKEYHGNGNVSSVGELVNGKKEGEWKVYNKSGQLIRIDDYKDGQLLGY